MFGVKMEEDRNEILRDNNLGDERRLLVCAFYDLKRRPT